jgi:hypothetical protein
LENAVTLHGPHAARQGINTVVLNQIPRLEVALWIFHAAAQRRSGFRCAVAPLRENFFVKLL